MRRWILTKDCRRIISNKYFNNPPYNEGAWKLLLKLKRALYRFQRTCRTCAATIAYGKWTMPSTSKQSMTSLAISTLFMEETQYHALLTTIILTWDLQAYLKPGEISVLETISQYAVEFWRLGDTTAGRETISSVLGALQVLCLTRSSQCLRCPPKSRPLATYLKQSLTGAMRTNMAVKSSYC